jgi:hypothetical protein
MALLCVNDLEYGLYDKEKWSFCHFLLQTGNFWENRSLTLEILSRNLKFYKTQKYMYTGPLCVTDTEYGLYDQEI